MKTDDDAAHNKAIDNKHAKFITDNSSEVLINTQQSQIKRQETACTHKRTLYDQRKQKMKKTLFISPNE